MGVAAWLRGESDPKGKRTGFAASSGVSTVDPSMHRSLLQLAGYSASQLPAYITREDCLKVPALSQGITTLLSIGGLLPLVATPSDQSNAFLAELDPDYQPSYTKAKTIDDLIHYAIAWWHITSRTSTGFPRTCRRIDPTRVRWDVGTQKVYIDGEEVNPDDMKRFDGLVEGLLTRGAEAVGTAIANQRQARTFAEHPLPPAILTDEEGAEEMETAEAQDVVTALNDTIRRRGIPYMRGIRLIPLGFTASEIQLNESRQNDAVEMARLLSMPSDYVNAPAQGSSLHYANIAEVRRDLIDVGGLAQYLGPIEERLSMPDMTPRGTVVKFDSASVFLRITPDQPSAPEVTV